MLSVDQLQAALGCTNAIAAAWVDSLNAAMVKYDINTPQRQAAFLAQIGYESDGLTCLEEDLDYSAAALLRQWPLHFTRTTANEYGRVDGVHPANPVMIANIAYASRFGNGPVSSGDGWRYRGQGPIQTTFLANFAVLHVKTGLDCVNNPSILTTPEGGSVAAAYYFKTHGCNEMADNGDFAAITAAIQGSDNSDPQREALWATVKQALGIVNPTTPSA